MELLSRNDRFLVVNCSILSNAAQFTVVEDSWDNWLTDHAVALEVDQARCQVVQVRHLDRLELLKSFDVVVCLGEAGELICWGEIFVACWCVYCIREEYVVVNVDVLLHWFIWVQRCQFPLNYSLSSSDGCVGKVLVHFHVGAILLHSVHVRIRVESFDGLEFFVPISVLLWIVAMSWGDGLADTFRWGYFDLLFLLDEPWVHRVSNGRDEVRFTLENWREVGLQVLAKCRTQLV